MGNRIYTAEEKKIIQEELLKNPFIRIEDIGKKINRSRASLYDEIARHGGRHHYTPNTQKPTRVFEKRPFSPSERLTIERMLKEGKGCYAISIALGRTKSGIHYEIIRGGGKDNYDAEKAANTRIVVGRKSESIEALQYQVKILSKSIKDIYGKLEEINDRLRQISISE